ncbi:hypothetical protein AALP_AAs55578U000200 [Arabis alpina]|uniref:Uncharacterized protein n=1 Tax=Arabis alpina TaxID=50452 RepID=A0A087FZX3_ARAAL|nr:hypothetical protein AALP_AAs55578U000200 [Arabis alpina]
MDPSHRSPDQPPPPPPFTMREAIEQIMDEEMEIVDEESDEETGEIVDDGVVMPPESIMTVVEPQNIIIFLRSETTVVFHFEKGKPALTYRCKCGRTHTFVVIGGRLFYKLRTGAIRSQVNETLVLRRPCGANYEERENTTVRRFCEGRVQYMTCHCKCGRLYKVKEILGRPRSA